MDEYSVLLTQVQTAAQELDQIARALDAPQVVPNLRDDLLDRVSVSLSTSIRKQRAALDGLQREVTQAASSEDNDQPFAKCWSAFREIQVANYNLSHEYLAVMQGSLARRAGLDNGLCALADAMLNDLSGRAGIAWGRFTILAEGEFFTDMAQIVRLRYPEVSIWNLPITAHEFGHFIGPAIRVRVADSATSQPFQDMLKAEQRSRGEQGWSFLHEQFADIFATYTLGPAFACACILLRFDPSTAYQDGIQHPSSAKRAYLILKTLNRMDQANRPKLYGSIVEQLEGMWQRSLAKAAQPESLDDVATQSLDQLHGKLYDLISTEMPEAQYKSWRQAEQLVDILQSGINSAPQLPKQLTGSQASIRIADVLNAAWYWRINNWNENPYLIYQIGDRALKLCQQLL